ncbi:armadillo-type protein [Zopfochytrium polystomum]|nr:armadillo-type protein [Zopfochytrium polystomum]
MDELERAIVAGLSPSANQALKEEAMVYFARVKDSPDGWQLGLNLFLAVPTRDPQIRFIALQLVEDLLRNQRRYHTIDPGTKSFLRQSLWAWLEKGVDPTVPDFLKNKFCQILVLLFRLQYQNSWQSFFDDLLALLSSSVGGPRSDLIVNLFLRICISIDEEVVAIDAIRSEDDLVLNTALKDQMRMSAVQRLRDAWLQILIANTTPSASKQSLEVAATTLRNIGQYVSWIDIKLVVVPEVINRLYEYLQHPSLRVSSLQCLLGIVEKGMTNVDKLDLIEALRAVNVLEPLWTATSDDSELLDQMAKYINAVGVEICRCCENLPPTRDSRGLALLLIQNLLPHAIRTLQSEYEEISTTVLPFADELLKLLKDAQKTNIVVGISDGSDPSLRGLLVHEVPKFIEESMFLLLGVFVSKLKYNEEDDFTFGNGAGEDEALFQELRRSLRSRLEQIDDTMFFSYFSSVVTSTFDTVVAATGRGQALTEALKWSEAELALHLIHIFKGPATAMEPLLEQMIKSVIHIPSIPLVYFEVIVRYSQFFQTRPEFLPVVLESFVDKRGLHFPNQAVQSRLFYLLLRFLKEGKDLKAKLQPFASKFVISVQDLLVVQPISPAPTPTLRTVSSSTLATDSSDDSEISYFDSQLSLFEAVGYFISLEPDSSKQEQLLQRVVGPLLATIKQILDSQLYKSDSPPDNMPVTTHLKQLITAIGSIGKGFPDYDVSTKSSVTPSPLWASVFKEALGLIVLVLQQLSTFEVIRESTRFAFQRLIGCIGNDILPYFEPMLAAGLLANCTTRELANFLPSLIQLMFKFKTSMFPILNDITTPLLERIFTGLNQEITGFDDKNDAINLRRAYLNFLNNIFVFELEGVLITEANYPLLNTVLQSCVFYGMDPSDYTAQKMALSALSKMVASWGSAPKPSATSNGVEIPTTILTARPAQSPDPNRSRKTGMVGAKPLNTDKKQKDGNLVAIGTGGRSPLPGFDKFIYESIVPALFQAPLKPDFSVQDPQTIAVFAELALVHKRILIVQGLEYLEFLNAYLPSIQCPPQLALQFTMALQQLPTKEFQGLLKVILQHRARSLPF